MTNDVNTLNSNSLGSVGENVVKGIFLKFGWTVSKPDPDFGIDLEVSPKDRHYPFAVQVKSGQSFFRRPKYKDQKLLGWWYRSNKPNHHKQWTNGAPVLLVLYDNDKDAAYWVHVTESKVEEHSAVWKIFVPVEQTLDKNHQNEIQQILYEFYSQPPTSGMSWNNNLETITRNNQIRHALLTPRIIAPHPNNYHDLSGIEVLAIHVLMREELDQAWYYDDKEIPAYLPFPIPKSFSQACDSDDWSWNAAAAIHKYLCHGDSTLILNLDTKAVTADEKVASAILKSVVYIDDDKYDEAKNCVENAHSTPNSELDEAWLYIQEARIYLALKNKDSISTASQKAYRAYRIVSKYTKYDHTAEALLASCSRILWRTNNPLFASNKDNANSLTLENHITAIDSAPQWWQEMKTGSALQRQFDQYYSSTISYQKITFHNGAKRELVSSSFIASCSANDYDWRESKRILGQIFYSITYENRDENKMLYAIDYLRRFDNNNQFKNAINIALRICSSQKLIQYAKSIDLSTVQDIELNNTLDYLCAIAAVLPQKYTQHIIHWCKQWINNNDILTSNSSDFIRGKKVIQLMFSCAQSADKATLKRVASWTYSTPAITNTAIADAFADGIRKIPSEIWHGVVQTRNLDNDCYPVRETLASLTKTDFLHNHLMNGEIEYLFNLDFETNLTAEEATVVQGKLIEIVSDTISSAKRGVYTVGGLQTEVALFLLGRFYPFLQNDSLLMNFLDETKILPHEKEPLITRLFWLNKLLTDSEKRQWAKHIELLSATPPPKFGFPEELKDIRPQAMRTLAALKLEEERTSILRTMFTLGSEYASAAFDVLSLFPQQQYVPYARFAIANSEDDIVLAAYHFLAVCAYRGLCDEDTYKAITEQASHGAYKVQSSICSAICKQVENSAPQGEWSTSLVRIAKRAGSSSIKWRLNHIDEESARRQNR